MHLLGSRFSAFFMVPSSFFFKARGRSPPGSICELGNEFCISGSSLLALALRLRGNSDRILCAHISDHSSDKAASRCPDGSCLVRLLQNVAYMEWYTTLHLFISLRWVHECTGFHFLSTFCLL